MEELYQIIIGIMILAIGIPLGDLLARATKEELKKRKNLFKTLIILSSIGAVIFLFLENDALLFGLLFIAIVTSRSLRKK
ncbi:MAG: hypothetical protein PHQ66_02740 [Candidatus Nanoarchaeia archaeon]|nr:hypothetical protein [Candidatus Nanoarchaeia archaeon]MDD5357717.1 hypothetical protein [Candidatus Nanoarchaeia archaeon]MDD5588636.1 hypothetical protein [Candidatus Nanoarchaeia archaeon]